MKLHRSLFIGRSWVSQLSQPKSSQHRRKIRRDGEMDSDGGLSLNHFAPDWQLALKVDLAFSSRTLQELTPNLTPKPLHAGRNRRQVRHYFHLRAAISDFRRPRYFQVPSTSSRAGKRGQGPMAGCNSRIDGFQNV